MPARCGREVGLSAASGPCPSAAGRQRLSCLVPRVQCLVCGVVRQVEIAFADPRRGYTRSFERYVLELSRRMTIRDVASQLGVGWDVIKDIQKRDLMRRFAKPRLKESLRTWPSTRSLSPRVIVT